MKPNYVFFGTSEFSVTILNQLKLRGFLPSLIVSTPDKPQGRNLILTPTLTKIWAQENNIPIFQPATLKDETVVEELKKYPANVFIVASYGKIIPQIILDIPARGTLNVHPSLLPKLRGPSPIEFTILQDQKQTGVSIMLLDAEMDHGPIIAQETYTVSEWPTAVELEKILGEKGGELIANILPDWIAGKIEAVPQNHSLATFCQKIKKVDGQINLEEDAYTNFRKIQAYSGWPSAFFFITKNGKQIRIVIKQAEYKNNTLTIKRIIPEGKQEMNYTDYIKNL